MTGDEQKPKCQNCVGKGLGCRYGIQLTFLQANTFSRLPEEARALPDSSLRTNKTLRVCASLPLLFNSHIQQFINRLQNNYTPTEFTARALESRDDDTFSQPRSPFVSSTPEHAIQEWHDVDTYNDLRNSSITDSAPDIDHHVHIEPQLIHHDQPPQALRYRNDHQYDADPFTPALITQTVLADRREPDIHQSMASGSRHLGHPLPLDSNSTSTSGHFLHPPPIAIQNTRRTSGRQVDRTNKKQIDYTTNEALLKFYIDEVAPWVRNYLSHSFGSLDF